MSNNKTFEDLKHDVYAFLDGELNTDEMKAYEDFIRDNQEARFFVNEIKDFEIELKSLEFLEEVDPPNDSWEKFQSKLNQDQMQLDIQLPESTIFDSIKNHLSSNWILYGAAAAASLALIVQDPVTSEMAVVQAESKSRSIIQKPLNLAKVDETPVAPSDWQHESDYKVQIKTKVAARFDDGAKLSQPISIESDPELAELPSLERILINEQELNAMVMMEDQGRKWAIDKFPVTNKEYAQFVLKTGHPAPFHWEGSDYRSADGTGLKPVTYVSFEDAQAFCKWENKRLPSKDEWEFAAGINQGSSYPWGDDFSVQLANTRESGIGLVDIGSYAGNISPSGVYDMSGNVRQWVDQDFVDGGATFFAKPGQYKMMKGGSFMDTSDHAKISHSMSGEKDTIYGNTGIRCASTGS